MLKEYKMLDNYIQQQRETMRRLHSLNKGTNDFVSSTNKMLRGEKDE